MSVNIIAYKIHGCVYEHNQNATVCWHIIAKLKTVINILLTTPFCCFTFHKKNYSSKCCILFRISTVLHNFSISIKRGFCRNHPTSSHVRHVSVNGSYADCMVIWWDYFFFPMFTEGSLEGNLYSVQL